MRQEYSGNIYRFPLAHKKGFAFAEILDYSDVSGFDGILMQVFDRIESEKKSTSDVEDVKKHKLLFGPVSINKYPKGSKWNLIGKDLNYPIDPPFFKRLKGAPLSNNWAELGPWVKEDRFADRIQNVDCLYEGVRRLETPILNHIDSVIDKVTMMVIIGEGEQVADYYNLHSLANKNIYLQVVNTYFEKNIAEDLIAQLDR